MASIDDAPARRMRQADGSAQNAALRSGRRARPFLGAALLLCTAALAGAASAARGEDAPGAEVVAPVIRQESAPSPAKPAPAEDKPAEAKPAEAKPDAAKPAEAAPTEPKPAEPPAGEGVPAKEGSPAAVGEGKAKPAPSSAPEAWTNPAPFQRVQEVLDAYGAGPSYFGIALDEQPLSQDEQEGIWRLLYAARRFQPKQILQWIVGEGHLAKISEDPFTTRGDLMHLRGEVRKIELVTLPPEAQRRLQMNEFYRCELDLPDDGGEPDAKRMTKAVVFSLTVPAAWRKATTFAPGVARTRCEAFFYKRTSVKEGVFITARMAWLAPGVLGDRDFDVSLFEQVRNHSGTLSNAAFYDMLAMVQRTNPDHLLRLTRVKKGAVDFETASIRDWAAFPWRLANDPEPSPARRLASLLPVEVQSRLKSVGLHHVDGELQEPLVAALNAVAARPDLYDAEAWRNQPLNFFDPELGELLREGLRPQGAEVVKQFEKALAQHREALSKARGAAPTPPAVEEAIRQAAAGLPPARLKRLNRLLLEHVFPAEIARSQPYSVYPLFLTPDSQQGRLIEVEGVARQILKVKVTDQEVVDRLKINEYYQICLFTADSQDWPLIVCVRQLPRGIEPGDNCCEYLRFRGFFLQTWRFDSMQSLTARAARARAAMSHKTGGQPPPPEQMRLQPPSPLIIAPAAIWVKDGAREQVDLELSVVGLSFLGCTALGVFLGMWHFQREDVEYKKALLERNISLRKHEEPDWSEIQMAPAADFSFLNLAAPPPPAGAPTGDAAKPASAEGGADASAKSAGEGGAAAPSTNAAPAAADAAAKPAAAAANPSPTTEPDPYADPTAFPASTPFQPQSHKPRDAAEDAPPAEGK